MVPLRSVGDTKHNEHNIDEGHIGRRVADPHLVRAEEDGETAVGGSKDNGGGSKDNGSGFGGDSPPCPRDSIRNDGRRSWDPLLDICLDKINFLA